MTTYLSTITTQHTWNEKKYSRADLLVTCTNPDERSDLVKESFKKCLFLHLQNVFDLLMVPRGAKLFSLMIE